MKIRYILPAFLATAVASQAATVSVIDVSNSTVTGSADTGTVLTTTLIVDNTVPPQDMVITISALNIDGSGGDNDSVALTSTSRGNSTTSPTTSANVTGPFDATPPENSFAVPASGLPREFFRVSVERM